MSETPESWEGQKWEYRAETPTSVTQEWLSGLGQQGWELVSLNYIPPPAGMPASLKGKIERIRAVFKRPLVAKSGPAFASSQRYT